MSVRPPAWNSSAATGRIFMKFDIWVFFEKKSVVKIQVLLTFWRRIFFLILAHPVYKMWIIPEQNMLELWNKLHFEEEKTESL